MTDTVSVLIPAHRAGPYLADAVRAAWMQADEVLVGVDGCDASRDAALALLVEARATPPRAAFRVFETLPHAGMFLVRNTLAALSVGSALFFADADDAMDSDAIAHVRAALEAGADLVQPRMVQATVTLAQIGNEAVRAGEGVFAIRRDAFMLTLGGFYPWYGMADLELLQRAAVVGLVIAETKHAVYTRRNHADQHTRWADSRVQKAERVLLEAAAARLERQRKVSVREKHPAYAAIARATIPMQEIFA